MSMMRCDNHGPWDSDYDERCPGCPEEAEVTTPNAGQTPTDQAKQAAPLDQKDQRILDLEWELDMATNAGVIECMVRNPAVSEHIGNQERTIATLTASLSERRAVLVCNGNCSDMEFRYNERILELERLLSERTKERSQARAAAFQLGFNGGSLDEIITELGRRVETAEAAARDERHPPPGYIVFGWYRDSSRIFIGLPEDSIPSDRILYTRALNLSQPENKTCKRCGQTVELGRQLDGCEDRECPLAK